MIDTIVLRLHNLQKYERSVRLFDLKEKKGYQLAKGTVPTNEVQELQKQGKSATQIINILRMRSTSEFLVKTQTGKRKNNSSHYELSYIINWTEEYLELNFSIPKYKFGSNVFMYVEHSRDVHFKYYENCQLDYNIKRAPELLLSFLKYFLKKEFILDDIDLADVEINRIDVCFNQIHKSKEVALYFNNCQKKIKKKNSRDEDGKNINYATSLMYATSRYGSKIYHKGTEYKKNDLKHHLRINEEKGYEFFKTEKIQELADRTLRYEITIRKTELNYLFKHNIFRKNCPLFKIDYANYKRISSTKQRNDRIAKTAGNLPKEEKAIYLKLNPYERISTEDKSTFKYVSSLMESSPLFKLKVSELSEVYNTKTIDNMECKTAIFSKELIALCLKKLSDFIHEFQLKELPEEEIISIKIDRYNSTHKHKLPKSDMMQFYDLLVKSGSFKEAARLSRYSKATLYRYKDRFKKIEITENNIKPEENFPFPEASIDLKDYHSFLRYELDLIRNGRIEYGL